MLYDLSVIIPARQEMFLAGTVEKLLENMRGNTEVTVVLDGAWADPGIRQHKRVNVIYVNKSIGQRAATNLGAKLSRAKYLMKLDAHCLWDEGCDIKMLEAFEKMGNSVTMVPVMRNLHTFSWKCYHCGWKEYQGPTPKRCPQCNERHHLKRKMMWVGKTNPQSTSYCFDAVPHFQYFEDYKHREVYIRDKAETGLTETMSLQGSCFMLTREKYWELDICDESLGSWGNQGIETAVKTWLSGGRVLANHATWYAHMFRTQGGDFGFPYPQSGHDVQRTKSNVKNLFWSGKWDKAIGPLSWLIERFSPVPGWSADDIDRLRGQEMQSQPMNLTHAG